MATERISPAQFPESLVHLHKACRRWCLTLHELSFEAHDRSTLCAKFQSNARRAYKLIRIADYLVFYLVCATFVY